MTMAEIVRDLAGNPINRLYGTPCKVISYDEETQTIEVEPIDGTADYLQARLQVEKSSGVLIIPSVGSVVMLEQTSINSGYITMYSEVDEIVFLDGTNGGLVKVSELVDKINTIENDINTLKNAFSSWVTVPNDGGAALKAITSSWSGQQMQPTQVSDLENEKVKH